MLYILNIHFFPYVCESQVGLRGWVGFKISKKQFFFCLFNNTICLEYSLLYGAGIDDSM